jgi:uncharacterized protein (TIGR00725 family)
MDKMVMIGVIGGSTAEPKYLDYAYQVGKLLAQRKAVLICGGREGIMEAACKGAVEEGGITVGILPFDNSEAANPYVTIPIATGMGTARNKIIVNTATAFIAIAGKYGTLSEIAFALDAGKRVVGIGTWDIEGIIKAELPEQAVKIVLGEK